MLSHDRKKMRNANKTEKDQEQKQVECDYFLEPVKLFTSVNNIS